MDTEVNRMARYQKQRKENYPVGSVSSATMRSEDLIPAFVTELKYRLEHGPRVSQETRRAHIQLAREITVREGGEDYYDSDVAYDDLESLFDALEEYAGPYFYFGAHSGDGADYGYWLSEGFKNDFDGLKVNDLSDVPAKYRGEVLHVNDHGNVSLYVKTARTLREVWAVV